MAPEDRERASTAWEALEIYRDRYSIDHMLEDVESLERSIARRQERQHAVRRRLADLVKQISAARSELRSIADEIEGSRIAGALLIDDILDRVRLENDERWSPTPIRAFRVWRVESGAIWGNQVTWTEPRLEGRCLRSIPGDDIPHSSTRCGPPACGIYAVKDLEMFPGSVARCEMRDTAVGVVALGGKVIEHELGYRARRASVIALAIHHNGRRLLFDRRSDIEILFRSPTDTIARLDANDVASPNEARAFLEMSQKEDTWT